MTLSSLLALHRLTDCVLCHEDCVFNYQDGVSPLNVASHNGHFEIVNMLLQHGARVDLIEKVGHNYTYLTQLHVHVHQQCY